MQVAPAPSLCRKSACFLTLNDSRKQVYIRASIAASQNSGRAPHHHLENEPEKTSVQNPTATFCCWSAADRAHQREVSAWALSLPNGAVRMQSACLQNIVGCTPSSRAGVPPGSWERLTARSRLRPH